MSENNLKKSKKQELSTEVDLVNKMYERGKRIRLGLLITGALLAFLGFLILVISYAFDYLVSGVSIDFEIIWALGLVLFILGLVMTLRITILDIPKWEIISNYLDKYIDIHEKPEKSTRFFSFPLNRLIAGALIVGIGLTDLFILTGAISHHQSPFGQAIVLGGPSYYYLVGLFPTIFGIGLLFYVCVSSYRGYFGNSENNLYFLEFRTTAPWITEVKKKNIEAIRYQNNQLGPKFIWLVLFLPFIVLSFLEGWYFIQVWNLENPIQPILFMVTAGVESVALYYLMLKPQSYFEIATKDDLYEMFLEPFNKNKEKVELIDREIEEFLGCSISDRTPTEFMNANKISTTHRDFTKLILGFILIGTSVPMWHFFILFGNFYWWFATIWGSILVVRFVSHDFSDRDGVTIEYSEGGKPFKFKQKFRNKFNNVCAINPSNVELTKQFRKLNAFDVLAIPGMLAFITIQLFQGWLFANEPSLQISMVFSTVFMVGVCVMVFIFLCVPINQVKFKTETIEYYIPVSVEGSSTLQFKAALSDPLKKTFIIRCLAIAIIIIASVIGISLSLASNFA